ncbi:MAG: hypothetical protein HY074_00335 [Deltaproteobacteria bacterium]|nr:hypothetical protein [Deltaproteobacteria bacterium]
MKPWQLLAEARTPEGNLMTLTCRGGEYLILADGKPLMGSKMKGSEEALATLGCARARALEEPCVLVGGLGMGFTLRATLDTLPAQAKVVIAELMPAVVEWNRAELGELAGRPLSDKRVEVRVGDVAGVLRDNSGRFDAVLLDVDNGPIAFTQTANNSLYSNEGLTIARAALKPRGVLAVWSAWGDRKFEHRLRYLGFEVETHNVRARLREGGPRHVIFVGSL